MDVLNNESPKKKLADNEFVIGLKHPKEYAAGLWFLTTNPENDEILIKGSPKVRSVCEGIVADLVRHGYEPSTKHQFPERVLEKRGSEILVSFYYYLARIPYLRSSN